MDHHVGQQRFLERLIAEANWQWQAQHQLMVTKAEIADVYIFYGTEGVVFPNVKFPTPASWPRICTAWDEFARLSWSHEPRLAHQFAPPKPPRSRSPPS